MFLEEFTFKDSPTAQIPVEHPAYWMEGFLKSANSGLGKQIAHDDEHEKQLVFWGCDPKHTGKLSIRKDENGEYFSDRLYHCMLHLAFWKEINDPDEKRQEAILKFEQQFNFNLDILTRPDSKEMNPGNY